MRSSTWLLVVLLAGCATPSVRDEDRSLVWSDDVIRVLEREQADVIEVARFSQLRPGDDLQPWEPWLMVRGNELTRYRAAEVDGVVAVEAEGVAGGSGMWRKIRVDPQHNPIMEWRWRLPPPAAGSPPLTAPARSRACRSRSTAIRRGSTSRTASSCAWPGR